MPRRLRLAEQWDQFARNVLPIGCSVDQRREMRRAFYAGCEGMMRAIMGELSDGSEVTPGDEQVMRDLHAEMREFAELVKGGRA